MRDDDVRSSCFAALDVLQAQHGPELPSRVCLTPGSTSAAAAPLLEPAYGIYRAANVQRGPAALSINSAFAQERYQDQGTADGVLYRYQDGPIDQSLQPWLREAHALDVPLVYFVGTRPNWYRPEYPAFVEDDTRANDRCSSLSERCAARLTNARRCTSATRSSGATSSAGQAEDPPSAVPRRRTSCVPRSVRDLHAQRDPPARRSTHHRRRGGRGRATVSNGVSLCSIHHRAFDEDLVGISADYNVHVSRRLLDDEDGPMLELLKRFHGGEILVPNRRAWQPKRERLALRFERFLARSA